MEVSGCCKEQDMAFQGSCRRVGVGGSENPTLAYSKPWMRLRKKVAASSSVTIKYKPKKGPENIEKQMTDITAY